MGRVGVQAPWPRDQRFLARSALRKLQWALNARGFDVGPPDGLMGPNTSRGVRQLQRSLGLPADGFPTQDLMARLEESSAAAVDGPMSGLPQ
jgi:membrane-bound lytic murein transglycosylase B